MLVGFKDTEYDMAAQQRAPLCCIWLVKMLPVSTWTLVSRSTTGCLVLPYQSLVRLDERSFGVGYQAALFVKSLIARL